MKKCIIILLCLIISACIKIEASHVLPNDVLVSVGLSKTVEEVQAEFNGLLYSWDSEKYGEILTESFDTLNCILYSKNATFETSCRIGNNEVKTLIEDMTLGDYDMLFYSDIENGYYYNGEYKTYLVSPSPITKSFKFEEDLPSLQNGEEQYAAHCEHVFDEAFEKISPIEIDGVLAFYYEVNVPLMMVSKVYMIQIVIYDDDKSTPMRVKKIDFLAINGLSSEYDLIQMSPTKKRGVIEFDDIKPLQTYDDYSCTVERLVTYGLPTEVSSWVGFENICEIGIKLSMEDGSTKLGKADITSKLNEKPYGGIINIVLNNSDLSKDILDNNNFDIDVENWNIHEIDILF